MTPEHSPKAPKTPRVKKAAPVRDRSGALYVLLDPEQLAAVDAWVTSLNVDNAGPQWTRTSLIRVLLARGLKERAEKGKAP